MNAWKEAIESCVKVMEVTAPTVHAHSVQPEEQPFAQSSEQASMSSF